jgi:hypothetical protein
MDVNGEMVVVQFLHPGREHVPSAGVSTMDWNQGKHRRKFLRVAGRCLDRQDALRSGTVSVWAGWEAQSRVLERHAGPAGKLPRFVHEPILARPTRREVRQNTDPYVFGEAFLYSNCRQFSGRGRPTRLQHLAAESLILFGAHLAGRFVLDTVLVVASRTPYTFGDVGRLRCPVSPAFRVATLEPLADLPDGHAWSAQLYRGVMYQDSQRGRMFSFAPARLDGARFSRPALRRSRFVNPDMTQGFKITTASTTTRSACLGGSRLPGTRPRPRPRHPPHRTRTAHIRPSRPAPPSDTPRRWLHRHRPNPGHLHTNHASPDGASATPVLTSMN